MDIEKHHKFMIVGCDGVWDVLSPDEAVNAIDGMKDPNMMAEYLVNMSMGKGTTDNTTAMVVRLND